MINYTTFHRGRRRFVRCRTGLEVSTRLDTIGIPPRGSAFSLLVLVAPISDSARRRSCPRGGGRPATSPPRASTASAGRTPCEKPAESEKSPLTLSPPPWCFGQVWPRVQAWQAGTLHERQGGSLRTYAISSAALSVELEAITASTALCAACPRATKSRSLSGGTATTRILDPCRGCRLTFDFRQRAAPAPIVPFSRVSAGRRAHWFLDSGLRRRRSCRACTCPAFPPRAGGRSPTRTDAAALGAAPRRDPAPAAAPWGASPNGRLFCVRRLNLR